MAGSTVVVDVQACIGCGACVEDCFPGTMHLNADGVAECLVPCLECGHCVAVCPQDAVRIEGLDMGEVEPCDGAALDPARALHAIKARRSIRQFQKRPLSDDVVHAMLEAGRYTPTARNLQGTSFTIIQREMPEFRELLWHEMPNVVRAVEAEVPAYARKFEGFIQAYEAGKDNLLFNASAFVVISTENMWDAGLAAANMEIVAAAHGAGVLHGGYMKRILSASPALRDWLGLGDAPVACCMLAGYPSVAYRRTAPRKPGKFVVR